MKTSTWPLTALLFLNLHLLSAQSFATEVAVKTPSFRLATEVRMGGVGGWDALTVDPDSHRLFVSHADRIVVIDTEKNQIVKEILDTPGVHAIAIASDFGKVFSSNGKENKVSVIDLKMLTTKTKIAVGDNPDLIVYEPSAHEVYVFNGKGRSVSIIDAKNEKVVATLDLPGKPEFAVVSAADRRVFVNIEDKNSLVAIDSQNHKVMNTWKLDGCDSPTGLAIDAQAHRLFSVCENQKMVMVDAATGRTITSVPTGEGADGAVFDDALKLAFSPNGKSGNITVVHEDGPDKLSVVQVLKSQVSARTIALDPKSHRIYVPAAELGERQKNGYPKVIDQTQKVLVFER